MSKWGESSNRWYHSAPPMYNFCGIFKLSIALITPTCSTARFSHEWLEVHSWKYHDQIIITAAAAAAVAVVVVVVVVLVVVVIATVKQSVNKYTGLNRPRGFQEAEAPRFHDNRHMKVVGFSALSTGRLTPRKYSWYTFLLEASSPPSIV